MNNFLNLHQSLVKSKEDLPSYLAAIKENQTFQATSSPSNVIDPLIGVITNLLSFSKSREQGLLFLETYLGQYSSEVLESKGVIWIELLIKVTSHEDVDSTAFKVLGKLVTAAAGIPDLNKTIQNKYIQKIVENITSSNSDSLEPLKCLEILLKLHPGACGIAKNSIETCCKAFVDSKTESLVEQAGKCLLLLQQTRGGGISGGVYKKCWNEYQTQLLGTLEALFIKMFKSVEDVTVEISKSEKFKVKELNLSPEPIVKYGQLITRFGNICKFLEVALLEPFPVPKSVKVNRLILFIERGLLIEQAVLNRKVNTDNVVLGTLLPRIHRHFLSLLKTLIFLLKGNVLVHSKLICDLLLRCLKYTTAKSNADNRPFINLRVTTYEVLILLMETTKNNMFVKAVSENLLKEIFLDITPSSDEIRLTLPKSKAENGIPKNRKFLQKLHQEKNIYKHLIHENDTEQRKLCKIALEVLSLLLNSTGILLKPVLHKIVQDKILTTSFLVISKRTSHFGDAECRAKLFETLYSLVINSSHISPPPLSYALEIFTRVKQWDVDQLVRKDCEIYLASIEKLIHPKKEVFFFPTDVQDFRDSMKFNQQVLQKFSEIPNLKVTEVTTEENVQNIDMDDDTEKDIVFDQSESESEEEPILEPPAKTPKVDESVKISNKLPTVVVVEESSDDESIEENKEEDVEMESSEKDDLKEQIIKEPVEPEPEVHKKQLSVKVSEPRKSSLDENALVEQYAADFNDELNADW